MVMTKSQEPAFTAPKAPVEMKRSVVAGGKPRRVGDVVEVNEREFVYLTNKGHAIPHLGEPVVKAKTKKRSKKSAGNG